MFAVEQTNYINDDPNFWKISWDVFVCGGEGDLGAIKVSKLLLLQSSEAHL